MRRRRTTTRTRQARELARLFAALDATGSERRTPVAATRTRAALGPQGRAG